MPEVVVDGDGHMARCVRVAVDNTELRLDDRVLAPA
jgi:hypothetical protein